jgi:NAD(P)H dehydrogenase (quinone)
MRVPATADQNMRKIRAVYHICPNMSSDEKAIGENILRASQKNGVERLVYHSVLHPQTEEMPHHWAKLRVEERIVKSGFRWTILQPTVYMQNILAQWEGISQQHAYPVPYPAGTRLSMVDLDDVAEAAAVVLTEPGHDGAIYELVGTLPMSQWDVVDRLSNVLERPISVERVSYEAFRANAQAAGLGAYQVDGLIKMFDYYASYGLIGNPRVLNWLLGRQPATLMDFLKRQI